MNLLSVRRVLVAAATLSLAVTAQATDISGAGATFPYPVYSKWADAYKTQTGVGLNYQSIGSGGGIKQIKAKTVTFGASDMPLKPEDLKASGLIQFPMIIGNCNRPAAFRSSGFNGISEAPKVTVLALICLMPPPEPMD